MTAAPPLGICTGTVEPGIAFGGFGPVDALMWRGACVGMCGWRPGTRPEGPRPECMDCARARHGLGDAYVKRGPWRPTVHALGAGFDGGVDRVERPVGDSFRRTTATHTVLRPAVEVSPTDPSLPAGVRRLAELRPGTRVTLAVAADAAGGIVATLAVRAPGIGYAVYRRAEGGAWGFSGGAVLAPRPPHRLPARPHLMRANVGQFTAALLGQEYDPNPVLDVAEVQRAPTPKGRCPGCGAEVSLTKAGAVYASHKCQTRAIEGRS